MSGLSKTLYEAAVEFRDGLVEHMEQFNSKHRETPLLTLDEYLGRARVFTKTRMALDESLVILKVSQ
jgi:hypothetical protein